MTSLAAPAGITRQDLGSRHSPLVLAATAALSCLFLLIFTPYLISHERPPLASQLLELLKNLSCLLSR